MISWLELSAILNRPIAFHRIFATVGRGAIPGLFLSQAFYWTNRTQDPEGWFYKTQDEWLEETALIRSEQERARRQLKKNGLIEEKKQGLPCKVFYRINKAALLQQISQLASKTIPANSNAVSDKQECSNEQTSSVFSANSNAGSSRHSIYTENTTDTTADIIPPYPPAGGQQKQPDSEQLNLGFPDSGTQPEDSELNRKTQLPEESSSLAKKTKILDKPEGSSPGANYSATANENYSHSCWDSTINSDNGSPGKIKKGGKKTSNKKGKKNIPSLSPEELNYFFQAYHAEKPSNFKTHTRKLLAEDEERIAKLVEKYGDRSLDMFVAALTYCREQTWSGWREGEKILTFLFYNNKVPMYADRHRDAMESDSQYRARVEGRALSMDKGRQPKVYDNDGNEVTGAAAEAFNAVASNPYLQRMLEL